MAEPVIELEDVRKTYTARGLAVEALRGVTLRIESGEYVAVMGPSGSGKSTLMHILGALDMPTSGRYLLAGQDLRDLDELALARIRNARVGFVFQQFHLMASMSAWRNVELPLRYGGVARAERRERAMAALELVGLAERVEHRPGQLSGGQQQRVAIARALVSAPALLLADEPTGNLDSVSAGEVLELLAAVQAGGRTVVLITHEPEVAAAAARTIRLRDGLVVADELTRAAP